MSKKNHIKGKVLGKFWCKKSKTGDAYLTGHLADEHGKRRVTLIKQFSKESADDADYLLLTYDLGKDFGDNKVEFSQAPVSGVTAEQENYGKPEYSDEDFDRWMAESGKREKK